ncbi:MAG TPA: hypothetical protein VGI40_09880 [Pirellulaceae bacterium]
MSTKNPDNLYVDTPSRTRRWFQVSLSTFFVSSMLLGIGIGLWFRPFIIETHRADGTIRTRFEVRRDWQGHVVANGAQRWFLRDGTVFTRTAFGDRLGDDDFASLLLDSDFDALIWLICETIRPESWGDAEPGTQFGVGRAFVFDFDPTHTLAD